MLQGERVVKVNIIQCDDKLTVMAIKKLTDGSGRDNIRLSVSHWKNGRKSEDVYKYWNGLHGSDSKSVKASEYDAELHHGWIACRETVYDTNIRNAKVKSRDNNIFITLTKLSTGSDAELLASRYRTVLDVMVDIRPNIIDYQPRPRSGSAAEGKKNITEATRQMLKRKFLIHEYEYNIYITDQEAGRKLFQEMQASAVKVYDNTAYIKGFDKNASGHKPNISVKCYNAAEKHKDVFLDIKELYKLEFTLRRPVFERLGISIADMTLQEECMNRLQMVIIEELFKLKGGETMQAIVREVTRDDSVLARVIRAERNIEAVKAKQEEDRKRINALEAAINQLQGKR
jgi:hypothetical protein